jgi:cell shape-determining protein MreD
MLKNIWQIITLVFIMSFLVLFQFSFISALPNPFRQFNLVLVILMFILFFLDFRTALISALSAGFWLDVASFNFFGLYLLIFFIVLLLAEWILRNWLTNRSFYALLVLMVSMTFVYNLLTAIILYLFSSNYATFFMGQSHFWLMLAYQIMWNFLSALILFNLAALLSKRIKPFFLEKKSFV